MNEREDTRVNANGYEAASAIVVGIAVDLIAAVAVVLVDDADADDGVGDADLQQLSTTVTDPCFLLLFRRRKKRKPIFVNR